LSKNKKYIGLIVDQKLTSTKELFSVKKKLIINSSLAFIKSILLHRTHKSLNNNMPSLFEMLIFPCYAERSITN